MRALAFLLLLAAAAAASGLSGPGMDGPIDTQEQPDHQEVAGRGRVSSGTHVV